MWKRKTTYIKYFTLPSVCLKVEELELSAFAVVHLIVLKQCSATLASKTVKKLLTEFERRQLMILSLIIVDKPDVLWDFCLALSNK